jgi:hypothetical protein
LPLPRHPRACSRPITVDDQEAEGGKYPEHQENVEDGGATQHQLKTIECEQEPGHAAEHGGSRHAPDDPGQQKDGQRADHSCRESPAERRQAEGPLTERHQDLAQWRMGYELRLELAMHAQEDVGIAGHELAVDVFEVLELDAVTQDRVGVRHVVRLVEDDRLGLAQPVETQEAAEDHDQHGPGPAPERAAGYERGAIAADPGQPRAFIGADRRHRLVGVHREPC